MLLLVFAHLAWLLALSVLRGTNLARPMWLGHVPGTAPDLVAQPRYWMAMVLFASAVAFGIWAAL
jgi:hypothetical protein